MNDRDPTPIAGTWRGQPNYQCRLCAFSTPEEQRFIAHFAATHPPLEIIDGGRADEPVEEPIALAAMTREQLDAYAAERGIEYPKSSTKSDVIAAIEAAQEVD